MTLTHASSEPKLKAEPVGSHTRPLEESDWRCHLPSGDIYRRRNSPYSCVDFRSVLLRRIGNCWLAVPDAARPVHVLDYSARCLDGRSSDWNYGSANHQSVGEFTKRGVIIQVKSLISVHKYGIIQSFNRTEIVTGLSTRTHQRVNHNDRGIFARHYVTLRRSEFSR